jgi:hypothetical protein
MQCTHIDPNAPSSGRKTLKAAESAAYATPENDTTSLPGLKSDTTSAGGRTS